MYIVFEGIVGTGKTTQSQKYVHYLRKKYPRKDVIWTREPGGTEIADEVRKVVQATKFKEEMDPLCETYLYAASRAQSLNNIIGPALKNNSIVVSDRNFISSLTNMAYGRKIGYNKVFEINKTLIEKFTPNKIVFLDLPLQIALERTFDSDGDKFESLGKDFYSLVYKGYREVQKKHPFKEIWINIDASGTPEQVLERIIQSVGL